MSSWTTSPLTWLITGASSGFGLALARLALSNGHKVIATSRNPARNPDLLAEIEGKGGQWRSLDVDDQDCGALVHNLEKEGTAIDVLVNNAGLSIHGPAESFSEKEVRQQMETVFFGPYRLIRAAVPYMRERRRGLILNISSGAGVEGRESMGIYGASKAAMDGLVRIMAKEVAPFDIRTLTVHLGGFDTNFATAHQTSKIPFPQDYAGSLTETVMTSFVPDGDHLKATKAIYEVVVGEGVGKGKEGERVLPLGRDMAKGMDYIAAGIQHRMETFREVCENVYLET
ncbi:hypothetical protein G7046_g9815 [Stylonectria norvegica]|nr:hypothetical protein G7046_g9815 [Stylonectria norvegica]